MREVTRDEKWENDTAKVLEQAANPIFVTGGPSESELVTIALLMRIYDLQLAILGETNPARADEIYDTHEKGGHFNPQIFIPKMGEPEE